MTLRAKTSRTRTLRLYIVGGASGVGKTTLIRSLTGVETLDTGTLFKEHLNLLSRDEIRKSDWSECEADVARDLATAVIEGCSRSDAIVVDTHFAAKIHGRTYRIGLKAQLIQDVVSQFFQYAKTDGNSANVGVILVTCNPHSLLDRRRRDKSRDRELVPSDCYNALRANSIRSMDYVKEAMRARSVDEEFGRQDVEYEVIDNKDRVESMAALESLVGGLA